MQTPHPPPEPALAAAVRGLTLNRLLTALLFLLVGAGAATTGPESDTWWQLRAGLLTWESGRVWTTDPLSWTGQGNHWPNHEWLSQLLFLGAFAASPVLLVALVSAVALLTWAGVARLCEGDARLRAPLLALGVMANAIVWSIRPHMLTILGAVALLTMLRRPRLQPWIPALFLLWANLHGGVAFGGALLVIGAGAAIWQERGSWRRWLAIIALSAAATLCTPLGPGLWGFTLSMVAHPQTASIQEWLPPRLGWLPSYPFFALAALWCGLLVARRGELARRLAGPERAWALTLLLAGALLLVMSSRAIRHSALFAVLALPLTSMLLAPLVRPRPQEPSLPRGLAHLVALLVAGLLAGWGVYASWAGHPERMRPIGEGLAAAVRACEGPLFNTYVAGGEILWFIPERQVFVDSRNDPYPLELLYAVAAVESGRPYDDLFARYPARCALVDVPSPLYTRLQQDEGWALQYSDGRRTLFARR